ncbi:MAG: GIY-YIG nuclease family protein [Candidatus Babeliales bacterium]|nr:GIY-YIG nuclease family protein [Candidatus Babeliales bacterium]
MFYVYILRSLAYPDQIYIGKTTNLKRRLLDHNSGSTFHTSKYMPWKLEIFVGFACEGKAIDFEIYLKNTSGKSFAKKHFL